MATAPTIDDLYPSGEKPEAPVTPAEITAGCAIGQTSDDLGLFAQQLDELLNRIRRVAGEYLPGRTRRRQSDLFNREA